MSYLLYFVIKKRKVLQFGDSNLSLNFIHLLCRHSPSYRTLIMIRLFVHLCKEFHEIKSIKMNDYDLLKKVCLVCPEPTPCPNCKAPANSYKKNGGYHRHFVYLNDANSVVDTDLYIRDLRCKSCGKTHALLNSLVIPYSSFSIGFIISILYYRLTHSNTSIAKLCDIFMISESTYYRIRRRLYTDYHQMCSLLNIMHDAIQLIKSLFSAPIHTLHDLLKEFFSNTGYSFMQPYIKFRQGIKNVNSS